ncbi:hypothetical protein F5Y18DRAFT_304729 [Xylariaceae sp. FL1019]|nr:hypothetical protein F5Y18DRAFT_304729 [Xylariaceae sp. FL1019]
MLQIGALLVASYHVVTGSCISAFAADVQQHLIRSHHMKSRSTYRDGTEECVGSFLTRACRLFLPRSQGISNTKVAKTAIFGVLYPTH